MIDEAFQEQASLYVLDLLEPAEKIQFESAMRASAELRALVDELRDAAAAIAHASPPRALPPGLEQRVLAAIQNDEKVVPFKKPVAWLPWSIAAILAILGSLVYVQLSQDLTKTRQALAEAKQASGLIVASLDSKLENAPKASAVVVWDEKNQSGLIRLNDAPKLEPGKDYQLWVIDPQYKNPVNGGVISAAATEAAIAFRVDQPIKEAQKFAVSVERTGGVPKAEGPIVFLSR